MLVELNISDFALIENLSVSFTRGLNIMTGETGAGKSILIGALTLLLGERATVESIRTGEDSASVEGLFDINDQSPLMGILKSNDIPLNDDNTLILSREISKTGKNKCRINNKLCTVSLLNEVGAYLVDVHGQHEHQSLIRPETHINFVDGYGGDNIGDLRSRAMKILEEIKSKRKTLKNYAGDSRAREREMDLLEFQINEIKSAQLMPGEDEELLQERKRLSHAEKIEEAVGSSYASLVERADGSISLSDELAGVVDSIMRVSEYDDSLKEVTELIQSCQYDLQEVGQMLRKYMDDFDYNRDRLVEVEQRVDEISRLKRKYGNTIKDIIQYLENTEKELDRLQNSRELASSIEREINDLSSEFIAIAKKLWDERKKVIPCLEQDVISEMSNLNMPNTAFKVSIPQEHNSEDIQIIEQNLNKLEFLFSPNPGEELKPLVKIASGGEISRVMLALKSVLGKVDQVPSMVFDEIDAGIGGKTATAVAKKLKNLSSNKQVICITHLPQIAAVGYSHYYIEKTTVNNRTSTNISLLDEGGRIMELARMLGSSMSSDTATSHAKELLRLARVD